MPGTPRNFEKYLKIDTLRALLLISDVLYFCKESNIYILFLNSLSTAPLNLFRSATKYSGEVHE